MGGTAQREGRLAFACSLHLLLVAGLRGREEPGNTEQDRAGGREKGEAEWEGAGKGKGKGKGEGEEERRGMEGGRAPR